LNAGLGAPSFEQCLKQAAELLDREASVANDTAHRYGVDGIVTRNGQDARPVSHYDVLPLTEDHKSGLFECPDCIEVIDARELWQG
jgi:hypothetical protein